MTLAVSWLALPLVVAALSLGCGLLVEVVAGVRLPTAALAAAGFALLIVVGQAATATGATASLATPSVVALAVAGVALQLRTIRPPDLWPLAAAAVAYAAYAAPAVVSGRATFAGYVKLDDTATYLAMLDRLMEGGRGMGGLAPSTYEATLSTTLAYGYPVGSLIPLGVGHELLGVDAAWLWQPYLAWLGALLALSLYAVTGRLVEPRPLRAAVAAVAAQPALLYGYSLWGGMKELATAALLPALAVFAVLASRSGSLRAVVPLAATSAALVGVLSVAGAVWLLVPLLVTAGAVARARGGGSAAKLAAAFAVSALVLAAPSVAAAVDWLPRTGAFRSEGELGNLPGALRWIQVFGTWLVGDFRRTPPHPFLSYGLIVVTAAATALGLVWAWSRRGVELLVYAGTVAFATAVFVVAGSPWIGGKALAVASPAAVLLAFVGSAALLARRRRVEAALLGAAVAAGVLASNVLAYRDVWLAPGSRLAELERIGERQAGEGPALMTEFEPYGARHFLRRLDAEGASELRRNLVPLRSGVPVPSQGFADLDRFGLPYLLAYRTLVLRHSPVASRPPSAYRLVERGRWYEVWRRDERAAPILEHVALGTALDPGAVPRCEEVLRLSTLTGVSRLAAVPREPVAVVSLATGDVPPDWTTRLRAPAAGRYGVWVGGSFVGRAVASVDGRPVGAARHELEWSGQFVELGETFLERGAHGIGLRYELGGWRPGSHGVAPFPLGPLVLAPDDPRRVLIVPPSRARSLCGRRLDWVEALR